MDKRIALYSKFLQSFGIDLTNDEMLDTAKRHVKAMEFFFKKESFNLKTFDACGFDEIVTVNNIDFYSLCEHHVLPFFGKATVGYIPNGKILGLSKVARIVDFCSKGLQTQERITKSIADFFEKNVDTKGVGVILVARHLCMEMRGVKKRGACTITQFFTGEFSSNENLKIRLLKQVDKNV